MFCGKTPTKCGPPVGSRLHLARGASGPRAAAATISAQDFASTTALAATTSAEIAGAAVAVSVKIKSVGIGSVGMWSVEIGITTGCARRDTSRHFGTTQATGRAARLLRCSSGTCVDPHLGTVVQHRRRRLRCLAAQILGMCQGYPRHRAVPPLLAPGGQMRLHSIRGSSLLSWAKHAPCRSCCLCRVGTATSSMGSI